MGKGLRVGQIWRTELEPEQNKGAGDLQKKVDSIKALIHSVNVTVVD